METVDPELLLSKTKNLTIGKISDTTNTVGKVIQDYNIIGVALGMILGRNIADFVDTLNSGLVMPNIQPWVDAIKGSSEQTFFGIKMKLSSIIEALIKFISLSLIVVALLNLGVSSFKPPSKIRNVNIIGIKPGLKL
jgi:large-conductance mechanosensitive channel